MPFLTNQMLLQSCYSQVLWPIAAVLLVMRRKRYNRTFLKTYGYTKTDHRTYKLQLCSSRWFIRTGIVFPLMMEHMYQNMLEKVI